MPNALILKDFKAFIFYSYCRLTRNTVAATGRVLGTGLRRQTGWRKVMTRDEEIHDPF